MTYSVTEMLEATRSVIKRRQMESWIAVWMTAIACHESAYGKKYPHDSHNVIGYHYIEGLGWSFIEATENGTDARRRYRKFGSLIECFDALRYLICQSSHHWYVLSRDNYERDFRHFLDNYKTGPRTQLIAPMLRRFWVREFSRGYCPADSNHGESVLRIYKDLINSHANQEERAVKIPEWYRTKGI